MLYREIIAVCSQIHTKHINTLCGQNVEFLCVKPGGIYSNHWALRCKASHQEDTWGNEGTAPCILNRGSGHLHAPAAFSLGKTTGADWTGV